MKKEVLVKFYAGDAEETVNMLELFDIDLDEWNSWSEIKQNSAIDVEFEIWMWNTGQIGWSIQ